MIIFGRFLLVTFTHILLLFFNKKLLLSSSLSLVSPSFILREGLGLPPAYPTPSPWAAASPPGCRSKAPLRTARRPLSQPTLPPSHAGLLLSSRAPTRRLVPPAAARLMVHPLHVVVPMRAGLLQPANVLC